MNMRKFIVGLHVGGLMEMPEEEITNIQVIEEINECVYFYGIVVGEIIDDVPYIMKNRITHLKGELPFDKSKIQMLDC